MTDEELSISDVTLIARLRNTPNWMREGFQNWKDNVRTYDTAPFEAAARIEQLVATNEALTKERDEADDLAKAAFADGASNNIRLAKTSYRVKWLEAKLAKAVEGLAPLAAIADAFDANELDDEARKFWGQHSFNTTPHEDIELYQGRGGRQLLTLANCMFARATLAELKGREP